MHFCRIDSVSQVEPGRIVALKNVSMAEEYLGDHFPGFPVLPGVFMLETLVQAGRALLERQPQGPGRWVLGEVRALRYGSFVRPGESLRVEVTLEGPPADGMASFKGSGTVVRAGTAAETAVSGRFTMRPLRTA